MARALESTYILFPEIQDRLPSEYKFLATELDSLLVIPAGILERVTAIFIHFHRHLSSMLCRVESGCGFGFRFLIKLLWTG